MTERPVLENIWCTFQFKGLWLQSGGIENAVNLSPSSCPYSQNLISRDVSKSQVKLRSGIWSEVREPFLIKKDKFLKARKQFILVEGRQIKMLRWLNQALKIIMGPECLRSTCRFVFNNWDSLKSRNTVMQTRGSCVDFNRLIRSNTWFAPASGHVPINLEHVISEDLSKTICTSLLRLCLSAIGFLDF